MNPLSNAIRIAVMAHDGQLYNDEPYIFHVMRVVMACPDEDTRILAALHDVLEDSPTPSIGWFMVLQGEGFGEHITEALDAITHRKGESYESYIERCGRNALARRVKMVDLEENSSRVENIADPARRARLRSRYANALVRLSQVELEQN